MFCKEFSFPFENAFAFEAFEENLSFFFTRIRLVTFFVATKKKNGNYSHIKITSYSCGRIKMIQHCFLPSVFSRCIIFFRNNLKN